MLLRIVSMLRKLGRQNYELREELAVYGDNDSDNDNEEDRESHPMGAG